MRSSSASSRKGFSLAKTFSRAPTVISDGAGDSKGPLGLTVLHEPPEARLDLIFVHGLGGGSRKTWCKSASLSQFWPQEWLPKDSAFKTVRIYSYGYDSDYLKGKEDCLNIHHIGKSFLGEMSTSPNLTCTKSPIVAVGHSMGGLVIKKAFILAQQDEAYRDLAGRFASVYFLATPHRGADSAKILRNILSAAYDRAYVADLSRNSGAIQVINDEFRHFSANMELWSFYETQNMSFFGSLVVDPESAVLGYREEKQMPVNADHRSICKFESPSDANYIILRNALASTADKLITATIESNRKEQQILLREVRKYLGLSEFLDDDFITVNEARLPDTCRWMLDREDFIEWKDWQSGNSRIFWVSGKPASGKSVLAGTVINDLLDCGRACHYFFFKHNDTSKAGVGHCLRSLALQIAVSDVRVRDIILNLQAEGTRLENLDDRVLWKVLFRRGIFTVIDSHQFWVIDALDECSNSSVLFDTVLSDIDHPASVSILTTSRDSVDMERRFSSLRADVRTLSISASDTLADMRLLVETKIATLSVIELEGRESLVETLLHRSKGSFLWTILILQELLHCYSSKDVERVIEDVPKGMEPLYKRTLDSMSKLSRGKELAKAILIWTTCAIRPLTVGELRDALRLEIRDDFPRLRESIEALCGHLVLVDKFDRVQLVHETAKAFLLDDMLDSEFAVTRTRGNSRLARVCLLYLNGEEMKPPRTTHRRGPAQTSDRRTDFALYACMAYSYHLDRAGLMMTGDLNLIQQFMRSNILTWVEVVAQRQQLGQLIRTAKHLSSVFNKCCSEFTPLDPRMRMIRQWSSDLTRVAAKFAHALLTSPAAIHSVIPPFCPTASMINNVNGASRRLQVHGSLNEQWDEKLLCIAFRDGQPSALHLGQDFVAIGLTTGAVVLYHAASYQELQVLDHGEAVKFITCRNNSDLIATCGLKMTKVWDLGSGQMVHNLKSPPRPLDMTFDGDMLLIASHKNHIARWKIILGDATLSEQVVPWSVSPGPDNLTPRRSPSAVAISTSHRLLAAAYPGQPISLWDLDEEAFYGECGKKLSSGQVSTHAVVALTFNPNPGIGLLAVAYLDGDLAILDPFGNHQLECFRANCQTLAASPSGRLLAAGSADGTIQVHEFDTCKLLYRVRSTQSFIKQLAFSTDNLRLADIRSAQFTVWEPTALMRRELNDDSSETTSASIVDTTSPESSAKITAIKPHQVAEVVFCGKDNGFVLIYDRKSAACLTTLYTHEAQVRLLAWCHQKSALLSIDASNQIILYEVQQVPSRGLLTKGSILFKSRLESEMAIMDVLVGEAESKFVVSTRQSDHFFTLAGKHVKDIIRQDEQLIRRWADHPESSHHVVSVDAFNVRVYCWADLSEIATFSLPSGLASYEMKTIAPVSFGQENMILLEMADRDGSAKTTALAAIDAKVLSLGDDADSARRQERRQATFEWSVFDSKSRSVADASSQHSSPQRGSGTSFLADVVAHVIGMCDPATLVFLDRSSWVCSVDLSKQRKYDSASKGDHCGRECHRHFFVPYDWFAGRRDIVSALVERDVMFARGGDLMVVRGCFEYAEKVEAL